MQLSQNIKPSVTLVGAGPGDPDLLTVRGANALASADVVLYDALSSDELLSYAPNRAVKVYVGKRGGQKSTAQEEINQMIVDYALKYGHVVRLKGGDPFIFGRGGEEKEFAEAHGIPVAIVPGISSAVAVPALQGIPITKRGVNQSFWVVTGTSKTDELTHDMKLAAASTATVVVLMGMRKLNQIMALFAAEGKDNLPVAIIQNGSTKEEKIGIGTVATIETVVKDQGLGAPAIIVVGEVVREHSQLKEVVSEMVHK